ncbi:MAG TPA: glutamyl-tRNA reductase [Rhabdochlamydiaceae bacterium]|nr:glutamyl-tRNA reductase [Rhabdochlamydiaceae bacterium]
MRVGLVGISYKSSDLYLRELLAKACQQCFGGESSHADRLNCVLLSTCNRTEVYFSAEDLAEAHSEILHLLRSWIDLPFEHKLYSYFGEDCFNHLALVTTGLDSVIIAESEIQRQVKEAYENACLYHHLPSCIHFMFQKSLKIGKWIRASSALVRTNVSLEGMIFELGQALFKNIKESSVLFIGNSEINRKIIRYFKLKGIDHLSLCTRGLVSAQEMSQEYRLHLLEWSNMSDWQDFDLVVCGTNQHEYLIHPGQMRYHPAKNQVIFDLSMPRNVDPRLNRDPLITLLNIDELGRLIDKKQQWHQLEIIQSEEAIKKAVERQLELFDRKNAYACHVGCQ